jgi:hypothetical protein
MALTPVKVNYVSLNIDNIDAINMQDIVRDHPNAKTCEILKLMGNRWQELSSEEKLIYYEMASQDKLRHADEVGNYLSCIIVV